MKVNFSRRVFYRKKSARLESWVFYSVFLFGIGYLAYFYVKKPLAPTEDANTYQKQLLFELIGEKAGEQLEVNASIISSKSFINFLKRNLKMKDKKPSDYQPKSPNYCFRSILFTNFIHIAESVLQ